MESIDLFFLGALGLVLAWASISHKGPVKAWRAITGNKDVLKGVAIAIAVGFSLWGSVKAFGQTSYFNDAHLFLGLEATKNTSPQCEVGGVDDRTTSNLGLNVGIITNSETRLDLTYRHHSCAWNEDADSYDAFGLSWSYRLFCRKNC